MIHIVAALAASAAKPSLIPIFTFPNHTTCGAWIDERQGSPYRGNSLQAWLLGYMTAHNEYARPPINAEVASMNAWMDNYCKANPFTNLAAAAYTMASELERTHPYVK